MFGIKHGKKWSSEDDEILKYLFNRHKSFEDMSKQLGRTWFACKCRLGKLGLIDISCEPNCEWAEKYRIPNPIIDSSKLESLIIDLPDTDEFINYNTFNDEELSIVANYLKARLSKVVVQLLDDSCTVKQVELEQSKQVLKDEIMILNSLQKMNITDREKIIHKFA